MSSKRQFLLGVVSFIAVFSAGCTASDESSDTSSVESKEEGLGAPVMGYRVVRTYPHNPRSFTQGLVYQGGLLYEGTGLNGRSTVRKVALDTGIALNMVPLERKYFGEGIALLDDRLIQLTWKGRVGFVYDKESLRRESQFAYGTEGWGITYDGRHLIVSDGSDVLQFWDTQDFSVQKTLSVRDGYEPVAALNELEWVDGEIWANVWKSDRIARIDPESGSVLAWIDLSGLHPKSDGDVLNGIAYDAEGKRIFVTGKLWSKLYEIEVISLGQ